MSFSWTSSDSSRHIDDSVYDNFQFSATTQTSPSPTDPRAEPSGLHAINDSNFETLIEILGTNGDGGGNDDFAILQTLDEQRGRQRPDEPASSPTDQISRRADGGEIPTENDVADVPPENATTEPGSPLLSGVRGLATPISPLCLPPTETTAPPKERNVRLAVTRMAPTSDETRRGERVDFTAASGFTQLNEQLGTAVSEAKEQVVNLRSRVQTLKSEVKEFAPHLFRRAFENPQTNRDTHKQPISSEEHRNYNGDGDHGPSTALPRAEKARVEHALIAAQDIVSGLSDEEARGILVNICQALRINPTDFVPSSQPNLDGDADYSITIPPRDLADVSRALRLVSEMDELVWRPTNRRPNGQEDRNADNIYSEENIRAMMDRVRLWERAARSRASLPSGV